MALPAGVLNLTLEYGKGLKDQDWIGRMDPYAIIKCGGQTVRTRTHIDGGRNPVWNQTFSFNIINENGCEIELWDEDTLSRNDRIGTCTISFAMARTRGSDTQQAPVMLSRNNKQHGFISVSMTFRANQVPGAASPYGAPAPYQYPPYQQPPQYGAPPPQYGAPPPQYGAPPPHYAPQPAYQHPPQYAPPPSPYGAQYPPQQAPQYQQPPYQPPPYQQPAPAPYAPPATQGVYYPPVPQAPPAGSGYAPQPYPPQQGYPQPYPPQAPPRYY